MADEIELTPDPRLHAGTWANRTRVTLGREEVTIDFAVLDPVEPKGTIVARVALPPGATFELRDALEEALGNYTERGRPE